jgi:hypothetical protein
MTKIRDCARISCFLVLGVTLSWTAVVPPPASTDDRTFHGTIREDAEAGDEVLLDSELRVVDDVSVSTEDKVCGYTIYKTGVVPLPFKVVLLDRKSGSAKIVLATGSQLDYEQKQTYDFDVAADDCQTGAHGLRDHVHVTIEDVNEFAPEWKDQTYVAEVTEGVIENEILRLDVADADGSEGFSKICHYHLLTPDVPFVIDENGYLRNTEALDYSVKHNFILEVKAEDCGGLLSEKLLVNILVKPACKTGWKGVVDHIEYALGSGRQLLAPNVSLELCDDVACQPSKVTVSVKLDIAAGDVRKCEVDSESIASRNQFCGASSDAVDLLKLAPATETPETGVFAFDGKSVAVDVSDSAVTFGGEGLAHRFTVATWMKHDRGDDEEMKQHVVCSADAEGMNRHHFAIFVHNCRLVLLLRQEPGPDVDLNVFKPAEWRWRLEQVCDGAWHHYAVSVDFPQVRLYVDGRLFVADKHNSAVIDDWPLHPTKKVKGTRLVVGACWEGVGHHLSQYLRGQLAGLILLNNRTESDHVIQCINSCEEKLDFHAINEMETGMSLSMNSDMSRLAINGHTKDGVEKLVARIGYVNTHTKPMAGSSSITLETAVACADGRDAVVPIVKIAVASAAPKPKFIVTLSGTTQMVREEHDVSHGTAIFRDLLILTMPAAETKDSAATDSEVAEVSAQAKLDSCTVQVEPPMSEEMEHLRVPENLMKQLAIKAEMTSSGIVLTGEGKTADYVEVLRGMHFVHNRPEDINMRTFRLTCVELTNHFASNQLSVQLSVIHRDPEQHEPVQAHAVGADKLSHSVPIPNVKQSEAKAPVAASPKYAAESSGAGIAVIAVVCIGFLVFLIILGIARIRSAQRRSVEVNMDDKQEMEWDNSALNITVNPLDREAAYDESEMNGLQAVADSDVDSDDDIGSFHDDGPDSSEQEAGDVDDDDDAEVGGHRVKDGKDRDLEWDSSTVSY